jgi:hypothetical protein
MIPKRFVHVGFNFESGNPPLDALEKTFNKAVDWIRYSYQGWILYTGLELDVWRDRIRNTPGIKDVDGLFLTEFSNYSGYMQEEIWEWLAKKRS